MFNKQRYILGVGRKLDSDKKTFITPVMLGAVSFLLYYFSLAPTYSWGDSADFAIRSAIGDQSWEGSPRDYDIFDLILKLFRNLDLVGIQAQANLVTAIFGAISVGLTSYLALIISKSIRVAAFSGCILMVSHTFWLMSVTAEVYTFNIVLILLVYINIVKYREKQNYRSLFYVGVFTGLCLSHHSTGLMVILSQAPLIYETLKRKNFKEFLIWFVTILLFGSIYIGRVIEALKNQQNLLNAFGVYRSTNFLNETNNYVEALKFAGFLIYNFPSALIICIIIILFRFRNLEKQKFVPEGTRFPLPYEPIIFSAIIIFGGIWSTIPDKHNIFVLAYPVVSVLIGKITVYFFDMLRPNYVKFLSLLCFTTLLSPMLYFSTYRLANEIGVNVSGARMLTDRDNNRYFLWPPKNGDYGPEILANKVLGDLPENSILIADYTIFMPLTFELKVQKKRSDVSLVFSESLLSTGLEDFYQENSRRRIFLATDTPPSYYGIDNLSPNLTLRRKGVIFELIQVGNDN